uniref:Uncharacterized protein n=1 Tax=Eptatretus burgeri TaxID=7764 RepID=A0A8C4N1U1_EPTBU
MKILITMNSPECLSLFFQFETVFGNISYYIGVEVLEVAEGSVKVLTSCMFSKESTMNDSYFNTLLKEMNDSATPYEHTCGLPTCDKKTTDCSYKDGIVSCDCSDGYVPSTYSNVNCIVCEPGQKAVNKKCEPCPFGYSGINCNDASLLEVVIISVVLGFIILVLIILIIVGCCVKKKEPENTYSNQGWKHNAGFSKNSPSVIPRNNSLLMDGDRPSRKQSFSNPSFKKECDNY